MADEPLRLDVAVGLGDDASAEELDEAARLLRGELLDAGLGEVGLAEAGPAPQGTRGSGGFLAGTLTLQLLPEAVRQALLLFGDWAGRRPGRTLRLAYGEGEHRLELEYDPDKTDINHVMELLLAQANRPAAVTVGGDLVGGDKVSRVSAGADAVGRDKITQFQVEAGATLIIGDPALAAGAPKPPPAEPDPPAAVAQPAEPPAD